MRTKSLFITAMLLCIALLPQSIRGQENFINGHEYVDLGLPSGTKWATCNVGAKTPEESGGYYCWAEVGTKASYTSENYSHFGRTIGNISGKAGYDVATAKWGGSWRMPTYAEIEELNNCCRWKWENRNGIEGFRVIGPNKNCIFLPAAGVRGEFLEQYNETACYWSSAEDSMHGAFSMHFSKCCDDFGSYHKFYGRCVRPVSR